MQECLETEVKSINKEQYECEIEQLKYCLEIGKEAYEQELTRTETLKMRTENLIKYSTVFIAVANLVISLADKGAFGVDAALCEKVLYVCLMVSIIICIIVALIAQGPSRTEMFPDGVWMLEEVYSNPDKYKYENERIYEMTLRYAGRTETMRESNDLSFRLIAFSYMMYILSIIFLTCLLIITVRV